MANLGNGHEFISKEYISIGMRSFGKVKAKPRELMFKVDKIILLWRVVIPDKLNSNYIDWIELIEYFESLNFSNTPRFLIGLSVRDKTSGE